MKKIFTILFIFITIFSFGQSPTSIKTRFPGIWWQSKDTLTATSADSIVVLANRGDQSLYFRWNNTGRWYKVNTGDMPDVFNPIQGYGINLTGTSPNITFTVDTTKIIPYTDTLYNYGVATKTDIRNAQYWQRTSNVLSPKNIGDVMQVSDGTFFSGTYLGQVQAGVLGNNYTALGSESHSFIRTGGLQLDLKTRNLTSGTKTVYIQNKNYTLADSAETVKYSDTTNTIATHFYVGQQIQIVGADSNFWYINGTDTISPKPYIGKNLSLIGSIKALGYNSSFLTVNSKMESSSTSGNFGTTTDHDVVFLTQNTERFRIFNSGNIALGSSGTNVNKGAKLQVNGTIYDSLVPHKLTQADTILVMNGGIVSYRTPSEIKSDIGANITSTGILWGDGTNVNGSLYTFQNDSTITFRGLKFLQQYITNQNPGGTDYSTFIGYRSGESFSSSPQGYANTGIGRGSLQSLTGSSPSDASSNTALGHNSGRSLTNTTGATLLGTGAGDALTTNSTSESVVGVGWHVFNQSPSAYRSVGIGSAAGYSMNSTLPSALVGFRAGINITTGGHTSAVGANVFENRTTGVRGNAIGALAGFNTNGDDVVMIGAFSDNNGSGNNNINIGSYTVNSSPGASGEINIGNVILGKGVTNDSSQNTSSQLGIGVNRASGIDASAKLDISSTTKGFLQPRMTEVQRAAIASPANGLQVYVTGTNKMKYYNGSSWKTLIDSASVIGNSGNQVISGLLTTDGFYTNGTTFPGDGTTTPGFASTSSGALGAYRTAATVGFFGRSNDGELFAFYDGTTQVGNISVTSTATAYNTSSDYRLKKNFKNFSGIDLIDKIKVYDFQWKSTNEHSYGVKAHELQKLVPYAVTGEKDGKEMQTVDYSKLVPILIRTIQEQNEKIKKLEKIVFKKRK